MTGFFTLLECFLLKKKLQCKVIYYIIKINKKVYLKNAYIIKSVRNTINNIKYNT